MLHPTIIRNLAVLLSPNSQHKGEFNKQHTSFFFKSKGKKNMNKIEAKTKNMKTKKIPRGLKSMWIILWILFGAFIGWLASIITKNNSRMGAGWNIVVGLVGSVIGGFIAQLIGIGSYSQFSIGGLLIALAGAVILLLIVNWIRSATTNK